jgi:hypothetical protein
VSTKLFPATQCSGLLKVPELIDFATTISNPADPYRAHKASAFLVSLANEFSSDNMYRKKDSVVARLSVDDMFANVGQALTLKTSSMAGFRSMRSFRTIGAVKAVDTEDRHRALSVVGLSADRDPPSPKSQKIARISSSMSFQDMGSLIADHPKKSNQRLAEASGYTHISEVAALMKV